MKTRIPSSKPEGDDYLGDGSPGQVLGIRRGRSGNFTEKFQLGRALVVMNGPLYEFAQTQRGDFPVAALEFDFAPVAVSHPIGPEFDRPRRLAGRLGRQAQSRPNAQEDEENQIWDSSNHLKCLMVNLRPSPVAGPLMSAPDSTNSGTR